MVKIVSSYASSVSIMAIFSMMAFNYLASRSTAFSARSRTAVVGATFAQQQHQSRPFLVPTKTTTTATTTTIHSTTASAENDETQKTKSTPTPMTLLSGFLGSGKTTALKHLLENAQNVKIGVIVNDVASVNIDAKLIAAGGNTADMVELQNGCACCSLADELFVSVEKLLKGRDLDAVVVELSGVADPVAIKSNWRAAPDKIRQMADVSRVVTLVDAGTFGTDYMTWE